MPDEPIWEPARHRSAPVVERFWTEHFPNASGSADTTSLHAWSCEHPGAFWRAMWEFADVVGSPGAIDLDPGDDLAEATFFPAGVIDVAATLLRGPDDDIVVVACDEHGTRERLTRATLRSRVASVAHRMRDAGVVPGDVVAAWSTTSADTLVVMLAAAACGATFTSASAEFGVDAVLRRFAQIDPKVLLVVGGYGYGGRWHDVRDRAAAIVAGLPTVRLVLTVDVEPDASSATEVVALASLTDDAPTDAPTSLPATTAVGFNDAGWVLYSSGTTGPPKAIVHRAGGVLLKHLSESMLHCDIRPGDRVFYYTTTSWMMWNWLVSTLAAGACVVLFDGAPLAPDRDVLLAMADRERVTYFGTSPTYLDALRREHPDGVIAHDLSHVRTVAVTGAPLSPEAARFAARMTGGARVLSKSGGTDLCGGLVTGDPTRPVFAGEIQAPAMGCAIAIVDDRGADVPTGERGELVVRTPFPSMPLGFVGDDDRSRLRAEYYDRFPGAWHQADYASRTAHGGYVVHGRSDTTLNVNGVRIGTAEISAQLASIQWVRSAIAVEFSMTETSTIALLVEIADDEPLTDARRDEIRHRLRTNCSPRHVPGVIEEVAELPRTMNGKLSEIAAGDAINGRPDRGMVLANPAASEAIGHLGARLRTPN